MASLLLLLLSVFARAAASAAFLVGEDADELKALRVSIANYAPVKAVLAGSLTIPCHITYLRPLPTSSTAGRRAVLGAPRVKWTFISEGQESEILVARGQKVKVSEGYRYRVSLPFYPASPTDATLVLSELRSNDSGIYRCDVQHGIEDGHDLVEVTVKGTQSRSLARPATETWTGSQACGTTGSWTQKTCTMCTATLRTSTVILTPKSAVSSPYCIRTTDASDQHPPGWP
uniref:Ig-like domain-containing protein n=1 Tax=Sphenodon punctatus TaxID=8508 RepID=A0A8D0GFX5_SPHPU